MFSVHQDKIAVFKKLVEKDRLGHAYLFFGDEGVGKGTFARALARYLERGTFAEDATPLSDAVVVEPNENGTIGIEELRGGNSAKKNKKAERLSGEWKVFPNVKQFLWQSPLLAPRRTVILDRAHALTPEAQSSLLKIVEDPPVHSLIILVTHEPSVLLAPILSRLVKVYFPRLSAPMLREILVKEYKVPAAKAAAVAKNSFGRLGRALELVEGNSAVSENLETEITDEVLRLRNQDVFKYARPIGMLLDQATSVARFSLNPKLQKRALDYIKTMFRIQ